MPPAKPRNSLRNLILAVAAIALGAWYWVEGVQPNVVPPKFAVVVPGVLYRSGELTPAMTKRLAKEHGIRTIIDLGAQDENSPQERRAVRTARVLGLERHRFFLDTDATGDPNRYVDALRVMADPAAQPVLVHAGRGSQQTGFVVALYRSIFEGATDEAALAETREHRRNPLGNPHLSRMYLVWRDEVEQSLRTGEPINPDAR